MKRKNTDSHVRAGFFGNVASADAAVRRLLAAGFSKDEIAVICPEEFKDELPKDIPAASEPGHGTVEGIAAGGALGATIGGLALVAAAVGTGGAALLGAAAVLVGGGAIAGSFSGLILADGYGKGVGEYYEQAVKLGKIVVGVEVEGADSQPASKRQRAFWLNAAPDSSRRPPSNRLAYRQGYSGQSRHLRSTHSEVTRAGDRAGVQVLHPRLLLTNKIARIPGTSLDTFMFESGMTATSPAMCAARPSAANFYIYHSKESFMFVRHLESTIDETRFEPNQILGMHQGRPLWVRYDLDAVKKAVRPQGFAGRVNSLWRYRELLPLPTGAEPVTLGEGMSPLLPCPRLGKELGLDRLFIKDESQLPTGSFKSRGMTTAVSMAKHFGLGRLAVPTAGNAGGALAAYGARAGVEVYVFMPDDTPVINQLEAYLCGAKVYLVNGLINDCGRIVREGTDKMGWFDMSTLKEPYRLEGKKTMGLELAEQHGWTLPDVILYPTGGGTGLIGMWKAFAELAELGWLKSPKLPKLVSCQSDGCAPIVRAFEAGTRFAELFLDAHTIASGLRVPMAVGDFMMLDAIRASGGWALAGRETRIALWMRRASSAEGIAICPETAVCFDCLEGLISEGKVRPDEEIVVFNTGAAQKYPEAVPLNLPRLSKDERIRYEELG